MADEASGICIRLFGPVFHPGYGERIGAMGRCKTIRRMLASGKTGVYAFPGEHGVSYSESKMRSIGRRNEGWGICGFTSSLYAMYQLNAAARPVLINAPRPFTILAEIKTYLELLYAANQTELLNGIELLTRSFGVVEGFDFSTFTPRSYIIYINNSVSNFVNKVTDQTDRAITSDPKFSIALPPEAVADYLQRIWGYSSVVQRMDPGGDAIIGVLDKTKDNAGKPYGGLCHYVYRKGGRIYSWGSSFGSLTEADEDFVACWYVSIIRAL